MSLSGIDSKVSTNTTLTSNSLIKGNGSSSITTSGVSCDGSNNLTGVNSITTSSITSTGNLSITSPTGKNINIDAQGTGVIDINNLEGTGIRFNTLSTTSTTAVAVVPDGDITKPCLVLQTYKLTPNNYYYPFIGAQIPGVSWQPVARDSRGAARPVEGLDEHAPGG